ncbi:MAG: BatD family protein [Bacteroidales bacterium]|nr:BatD family protein [Bacteroidales bacterium]
MKRWYFIILLLIVKSVSAQNVVFKASAPEVVEVGQQFRLLYTVNARAYDFSAQAVNGINVLAGPSTSQSSNISIINGKVSQNVEYTFTYVVQATKKGNYKIPPAEVKVDGKVYKSNAIQVEAIKGNVSKQGHSVNNGARIQQSQDNINQTTSKKDAFLRIIVDKKNVHREEGVVITIKLYKRLPIIDFSDIKWPMFDGFVKENVYSPNVINWVRENVNGRIYETGVLSKYILFPQKTGSITIDPAELEFIYQKQSRGRGRSLFDDFFGSIERAKARIKSNSVKINVKPLPANKPSDYSGAVGKFKLTTSIDNKSVKTNDAINLKVRISGNGNLKYINPLNIDFPSDFDVYDPKIADNIKYSEKGSIGSKSFEYLIIPRHAGNFTIPAFNFTYFDTSVDKYKTEKGGPFTIKVSKSDGDTTVTVSSAFTKEDVKFFGKDIRFIHNKKIKLQPINSFVFGSVSFYFAYIVLLLLFVAVFVIRRKKIKTNANIVLAKNKKANKFARKRLNKASGFMKQDQHEAFYEELVKAMWGYISDKLGISLADLSKDNARNEMLAKNVDQEYIDQILSIIDRCEYARYAPVTEETRMDNLYNDAIKVISKLQQKLK